MMMIFFVLFYISCRFCSNCDLFVCFFSFIPFPCFFQLTFLIYLCPISSDHFLLFFLIKCSRNEFVIQFICRFSLLFPASILPCLLSFYICSELQSMIHSIDTYCISLWPHFFPISYLIFSHFVCHISPILHCLFHFF